MFRRTLIASMIALASAPAFAATYTLDPNHTQVQFIWNHYGFSNLVGQFGKIDATIEFDPADPTQSKVTATIPMNTLNSNIAGLDTKLESPDYFDAAKYPTATFKSTKVEKGAAPDQLRMTGDLSLHGVTKQLTLDVMVVKVGEHPMRKAPAAGFEATGVIKRSDFGITKYLPNVGDYVKIHVVAEAVEAKAFAESQKK